MAAFIRRLGNLSKSFHAATRPRLNLTIKSLCTKVSTQESELQSLVDNFKKSCEDQKFRYLKDVYAGHVRRLAKAKQFSMIEQVIEHQKKYPDIRQEGFAARLISLYGESGMFEHARKLFDQLPSLGCPRTVKSFNALLKSAIAAKELHRVTELFKDLPSEVSVEPNVVSHNTIVHALCEMGSIDEALAKFREMDKTANIFTYNTLFDALYKNRRFSEAESLWVAMEESGIKPTTFSYNIRLKGMFSEKKFDEAVLLAAEMREKGLKADAYTYNTLIVGFCGNGNLEEAKKCYDDLQKNKRVLRLGSTYSTLIPVCCEAGEFDKAFEICSDAVKHKISLNLYVCQQVIYGLSKNGKTEKASELSKLLRRGE